MPQRSRDVHRSVTRRAFRLLETFSPDRPVMTLSEIAAHAKLPLTTTYRLVNDLVDCGALERDGAGRYRIGLRLWEIASLAPRALGLRELAMPVLGDLYEATHQNIQLAVREGLEVVYVERIVSHGVEPEWSRVGGRLPIHAPGVGLALLAFAPADVQEAALAGPLKSFTPRTITDRRTLRQVLDKVRKTNVAISSGQVSPDARSIAAPIIDGQGAAVAALAIVIRDPSIDSHSLIPTVLTSARTISRLVKENQRKWS